MAEMKIFIPDTIAPNMIKVLAKRFGYMENIMDGNNEIPNPISKADHIKACIIAYMKGQYREAKADEAARLCVNDLDEVV